MLKKLFSCFWTIYFMVSFITKYSSTIAFICICFYIRLMLVFRIVLYYTQYERVKCLNNNLLKNISIYDWYCFIIQRSITMITWTQFLNRRKKTFIRFSKNLFVIKKKNTHTHTHKIDGYHTVYYIQSIILMTINVCTVEHSQW